LFRPSLKATAAVSSIALVLWSSDAGDRPAKQRAGPTLDDDGLFVDDHLFDESLDDRGSLPG
jgi:hypothetical protein